MFYFVTSRTQSLGGSFIIGGEGGGGVQIGDPVSLLLNDAGYLTAALQAGDPVSALLNDAGYLASIAGQLHSALNLDDGSNPHGTTKADVGLSNVDNTSDANKPISDATQTALDAIGTPVTVGGLGEYTIFDGGLIVQKGSINVAIGGTAIVFPIAFTNTNFQLVAVYNAAIAGNGETNNRFVGHNTKTVSGVNAFVHASASHGNFGADSGAEDDGGTIDWIAIGS